MPVETAADRAIFVSPNDFGVAATLRHAGTNVEASVDGILDMETYEADLGEQMVQTESPRFVLPTSSVPDELVDNLEEAELDITSTALTAAALPTTHAGTYAIRRHLADGTGMSELWLEYVRELP